MFTFLRSSLIALLAIVAFSAEARATPLTLDYSITTTGTNLYTYNFTLILNNNDGSWQKGQYFNWITFGDVANASTDLKNFVGSAKSLPIGPFTKYAISAGGHNGPTLLDVSNFKGWIPTAIGAELTWSGTSSVYLKQGQLLWSNVLGNGVNADFAVANLIIPSGTTTQKTLFVSSRTIPAVPLPPALPMFGAAILGVVGIGTRKSRKSID